MKSIKLHIRKFVVLVLLSLCTGAIAGPIIISGTDSDDHGFASGGVNQDGWEFMQKAFVNVGGAVTNGNKVIVCIGCNGSQASAAFSSATSLSSLNATWTFVTLTSAADITNFFNGTGPTNVNNTGILYMPTVSSNVSGGIADSQLSIVNANSVALNNFVNAGGGLFTQEEANSSIGYGWMNALLPGFTVKGDNQGGVFDSANLVLTAAGSAAFPGLTNADLVNATPWHAYFENYGGLQALAFGNGDGIGGLNDAVIIGGGINAVLVCGVAGAPACNVPEPTPFALFILGGLALFLVRLKVISS